MDSVRSSSAAARAAASTKIVIAGGFGVGKTTLVGSVSEIQPLRTEALVTNESEGVDDLEAVPSKSTTTVAMEGDGRATIYAGGWSDYQAQRQPEAAAPGRAEPRPERPAPREEPRPRHKAKLGFAESHRLGQLPAEIDRLTAEIGKLEALLTDPGLFTREPAKFQKATEALAERQQALAAAEEEWLALAERAEA